MKISKKFLNEFIELDNINFQDLANKMVFAGNEYESVTKMCSATGLLIGEVLKVERHPESDHLNICEVKWNGESKQIVCGATNVLANKKVIVAPVGATLPGGVVIKKATIAGVVSEGMICSLGELGIASKYLSEEDKNGIHILDDCAPVSGDALSYLGLDDEVIDFELTSNRADLMSYLGMAYEVKAIYGGDVKLPSNTFKETDENINDIYKLSVNTDNCSIYLGKLVKGVTIKESPDFIKNRLIASGIRPINNVVDISNYVMLELGCPLHFFDADKLGTNIEVTMASDDDCLITLDNVKRTLDSADIIIKTDKPVALAGVMGGLLTEVTSQTTDIFIESAIFNAYAVRQTSKKIVRSEASSRFEKGLDPNRVLFGLERACALLQCYADGKVVAGVLSYDTTSKALKDIYVTLDKINGVLGMNITIDEVSTILNNLEFNHEINNNTFLIHVPTRRLDVNIKEDVIEEIGRCYGYDKVTGIMPVMGQTVGTYTKKEVLKKEIRRVLSALGLNQVITYSLIGLGDVNKFINGTFTPISIIDPMSEDKKYMRGSIIPSLLKVYDYNFARRVADINIFELGASYAFFNNVYLEEDKVSGLMFGNYLVNDWNHTTVRIDFYVLKGIIENILNYLGFYNRYCFTTEVLPNDFHPKRSCMIKIDNEIVGFMGQIHPIISKNEIYLFEISIDKILDHRVRPIKYHEISKYPSVNKDVGFVMDKQLPSEIITNIIKKTGGRLLKNVSIFDVYYFDNSNEKSIAYSLTFQDENKTLNDDEVMNLFNNIIESVTVKTGVKLRDN